MPAPKPFNTPAAGAKTALVVDDDPIVCKVVAATLSQKFTVYVAESAERATETLDAVTPDLLVCDIMMPKVDGLQWVKLARARKELAKVPVIFLTSKSSPLDVVAGINAGARYYLTKPVNPADLLDKAVRATR
jgi:DNA-binding response OmpR family regulator